MAKFRIDIGNGQSMKVNQGAGDLKAAYQYAKGGTPDYSRISAYRGADVGVHTGSKSPTVARHNQKYRGK